MTEPPSDDIHALELDFAKHPNSDAFVPLCEAYLRQFKERVQKRKAKSPFAFSIEHPGDFSFFTRPE